MPPSSIGHIGPAPWQLPALIAVACATTLALACCALVLFAPDQHAVRRLIRRAVPLATAAGALSLACAITPRTVSPSMRVAPTGPDRLALDFLLCCGWYIVALTVLTLARAYTLIAVGPLHLQPTARLVDIAGHSHHAVRTAATSAANTTTPRLFGRWPALLAILTAASLALPSLATGLAPASAASNAHTPDAATALLFVIVNATAALAAYLLAPDAPGAARALLTAVTLATALSLAYNTWLLLAR